MAPDELFTIPIAPTDAYPGGGSIVCTEPAPQVYLLTWEAAPDNRLTSAFVAALSAALDAVEFGGGGGGGGGPAGGGVLVTASAIPKFYSNGLHLEAALSAPGFFGRELYPLWRRLLTYPMPTVALVAGHCFAGGLMLAMHHDYRVFAGGGGRRAHLCLNEIDFGVPLMPPMSSIFRAKTAPHVYRRLVLEAHRFDGPQALEAGLVDALGGLDAVLALVRDRGLVKKGATGVYGLLKAEMYRESVALLDSAGGGKEALAAIQAAEKKRKAEGAKRLEEWKRAQGEKSKL